MNNTNQTETQVETVPDSVQQSQRAWRQLGMAIRSITPAGLVRFGLVTGALVAIGWLIKVTWVALVPFIIGAVIAYILLPVVNWLDRWLPRSLAAVITLISALAVFGFFLALLVPALVEQTYRLYLLMPSVDELRNYVEQARAYIQTLPESTQETAYQLVQQASSTVRSNVDIYLRNLVSVLVAIVLDLFNTVGFILGFLIVPTWLLTVLNEHKTGVKAIDDLLPDWMRADFWAVLRIFDRTFRAFFQGQFLLGLINGFAIYFGLSLMETLGWPEFKYKLLAAIFIGVMHFIPSIGPFLGAIPAILAMMFQSVFMGVSALALYILIQWLVNMLVVPHIERKIVGIHPAVLIVVIVALSELGIWWILLAAPITAIIRDLFRYVYGRFSNPPRPAGLLPDEALLLEMEARPSAAAGYVPLAYRRNRSLRKTQS